MPPYRKGTRIDPWEGPVVDHFMKNKFLVSRGTRTKPEKKTFKFRSQIICNCWPPGEDNIMAAGRPPAAAGFAPHRRGS